MRPQWWSSPDRWWYVERPFPLPLIALCVVVFAVVASAVILAVVLT